MRSEAIRRLLAHRRVPLAVTALAVLLSAPSLWLGLQSDDYVLWLALAEPPPVPAWSRPAWRLFGFFADEALVRHAIDTGAAPWWTSPDLRLAFFRPLTGISHWLDVRLWPERPWLMHVHSLVWFGATIAAAAALYRRLLRPPWIAGLAALVFAVDDAHALPAAWIANRNATVGTLFVLLALLAHDRWRRDGWRPGSVLAPVALVLGLLGGEIALAGGAYLLAYALFLDEATPRRRLASLVPSALAGLAWAISYRSLGFGVGGSAMYIDPVASPLEFVRAVVSRGPLLLFGQWAVPSQLSLMLSARAAYWWWLFACAGALVIAWLLAPLVRRDRTARFFALGMMLSLLPACSTFPHDRLLFAVGVGGAGLLAQWLAGLVDGDAWRPAGRAWRRLASVAGAAAVVVHLLFAPLALNRSPGTVRAFGGIIERGANSLPGGPHVGDKTLVVVQTPTAFTTLYGPALLAATGRPTPKRLLVLGSGIHATTLERPREDTLVVRPVGGYLLPPGSPVPGSTQPDVDPRYLLSLFDRLYRDARPWRRGERLELPGVTIEIVALTDDLRPAEVAFRFEAGLADPSLVWLRWENWAYVPFEPPPVGGRVTLPPPAIRPF